MGGPIAMMLKDEVENETLKNKIFIFSQIGQFVDRINLLSIDELDLEN